jgi:hypothetical protein
LKKFKRSGHHAGGLKYLGFHDIQLPSKTLKVGVEMNVAHYLHQLLSVWELLLI